MRLQRVGHDWAIFTFKGLLTWLMSLSPINTLSMLWVSVTYLEEGLGSDNLVFFFSFVWFHHTVPILITNMHINTLFSLMQNHCTLIPKVLSFWITWQSTKVGSFTSQWPFRQLYTVLDVVLNDFNLANHMFYFFSPKILALLMSAES